MKRTLQGAELPDGLRAQRMLRQLPAGALDLDARTFELSIASETPVERYAWDLGEFDEVLLCRAENVDLSRMTPEAAGPLLLEHDRRSQVGVLLEARIDSDNVVRGRARVQRSEAGDQLLRDLEDGIRRNVSVGYQILAIELHEAKGERPRVVVTRWQPFEASIVAAGADASVGVGRNRASSREDEAAWGSALAALRRKGKNMDDEPTTPTNPSAKPEPRVDVSAIREEARKAEQTRAREIYAIGERFDMRAEAQKAVGEGTSVEEFKQAALDKIEARQLEREKRPTVDLPKADQERYSLGRVVRALLDDDPEHCAHERAVSAAYVDALGIKLRRRNSVYVPLRFFVDAGAQRRLQRARLERGFAAAGALNLYRDVTKGGSGANLVATDHRDDEYVPHLLSDLVLAQAGARILPGLVGDVDIPAGSGSFGNAAYISSETGNASEITPVFRNVPLTPKTAGAYVDFTRRMRQQSEPAIEQIVRMGIEDSLLELIERSALSADGSGGAITGLYEVGTTGSSPFASSFVYGDFVQMWAGVRQAKGSRARLGFVSSFGVAAKAMVTSRDTGSGQMILSMSADGVMRIDGWPFYATQESPQAFGSPAILHGVAFGDWSRMLFGVWGDGIELATDDAALALSGGRRIIGFYDHDLAITLGEAFQLAEDVSVGA